MSFVIGISELLATFIEAYIGIKFAGILLVEKIEKRKLNLISILISIIVSPIVKVMNNIQLFSYITLMFGVIIVVFAIWKLYVCHFSHAFLISSFYFMCVNYLDFFSISLVGVILHDRDYSRYVITTYSLIRLRQLVICKAVLIIFYCVARKYIKIKFRSDYFKHCCILIIFGTIGVIYLVKNTIAALDSSDIFSWTTFSIILFMSGSLFVMYEKNRHEIDMMHFMEIKNQLLQDNYKSLNEAYSANAKVYHDFNNHINVLYQYLLKNQVDLAIDYLDSIGNPVKSLLEKIWTGHEVIDVIINSKLKKIKENDIQVKLNVEFPNNSSILSSDICAILSNLLDNSIEACQKNVNSENKWIELTIRKINAMLVLKIRNGIENRPIEKNSNLVTSKKDSRFHGWGMKSIESTVEKYEGVMKYNIDENAFQVVVTLNYEIIDVSGL